MKSNDQHAERRGSSVFGAVVGAVASAPRTVVSHVPVVGTFVAKSKESRQTRKKASAGLALRVQVLERLKSTDSSSSEITKLSAEEYSDLWEYRGKEADRRFLISSFAGREYQSKLRIGRLKVKVLEAVNLPGVVLAAGGKPTASPYVIMRMEGRAWQSETKHHDLNPKWATTAENDDKHVIFYVNRHDAKLTVEVCDEGEHHDDRLGFIEIELSRLAGHGKVRRFFLLKSHLLDPGTALVSSQFAHSTSAIQLELEYELSPLGEAASRVWLPLPDPPKPPPPFDAETFYRNGLAFKAEMAPYLQFNTSIQSALRWHNVDSSLIYFFGALSLALYWQRFFTILHCLALYKLGKNFIAARRLTEIRRLATSIFAAIDTNHSNTLSRSEISQAIDQLIKKGKCSKDQKPTEKDIDTLFSKYAKSKDAELTLRDFEAMLMNCPQIVGNAGVLLSRARQVKPGVEATLHAHFSGELRQSSDESFDAVLNDAQRHSEESSDISETEIIAASSVHPSEITTARPVTARIVPEATSEKKTRPSKGFKNAVAKNLLNRVGRRISFLSFISAQLGAMARDLALVRRVFAWDPAVDSLSKAAVAGNLFCAILHRWLPTAYFIFMVSMAFFYYSEKRKALERLVKLGPAALKRHRDLVDKVNLDKDILIDDGRPQPQRVSKSIAANPLGGAARLLLPLSGGSIDVRSAAYEGVVRGVFSRLDTDNSRTVSVDEILSFVLTALPRATAALRSKCSASKDDPDPAEIRNHAIDIIEKFDKDHDNELNYTEFFSFVTTTGCSALLLQDEIRRQLLTTGVSCLKLPSRAAPSSAVNSASGHKPTPSSSSHIFGSHHTHLALAKEGTTISYTNRHGHPIILGQVTAITSHPDRPNILRIIHKDPPKLFTKSLVLSISDQLRDGLVDVLLYELKLDVRASPTTKLPPSPTTKSPVESVTITAKSSPSSSSTSKKAAIPSSRQQKRMTTKVAVTNSTYDSDLSQFAALSG